VKSRLSITVVGAGAVGRSIALALFYAGADIVSIFSESGVSARSLARRVKAAQAGKLSDATRVGRVILICVPDSSINEAVRELSRNSFLKKGMIVLQTSGAVNSRVLDPLRKRGVSAGSFHPMQSFPRDRTTNLKEIWWSVEGDRAAVKTAREVVKKLHSKIFTIPKEAKVLYHTAGVFASNYIVILLSIVEEIALEVNISPKDVWKIFLPIILSTIENVATTSPVKALTGPIARGDAETVARHIKALSQKKLHRLVSVYSILGIETARLAKKKYARRLSHP